MRTKDLIRIADCFSAWIFGNLCELRILYVLLSLFGLDIWKPVRTKDLIRIVLLLETRFSYCYCSSDIWKPVRTEDLICIVLVFRLGYLETKDLICIVIVFRLGYLETHAN